jgi:hypothetical protein
MGPSLVVGGYVCAGLALLIFPPFLGEIGAISAIVLGAIGAIIAIVNIFSGQARRRTHGSYQLILNVCCGVLGAILGVVIGSVGTHGGGPRTADEKRIAEQILSSGLPVEWERWGPHDLEGALSAKDPGREKRYRVRFRIKQPGMKWVTFDGIFTFEDGKPGDMPFPNLWGDAWLDVMRRSIREQDPFRLR